MPYKHWHSPHKVALHAKAETLETKQTELSDQVYKSANDLSGDARFHRARHAAVWEVAQEGWERLSTKTINAQVDSMPIRLKAVIDSRRATTGLLIEA